MRDKIKYLVLFCVCFSMISCLLPATSWARLVIETEVVSGSITRKYADHSVALDNGKKYQPSRKGLSIDLPVGKTVTLRVVKEAGKNIFFDFAPGLNSLKELPPMPQKDNSPS